MSSAHQKTQAEAIVKNHVLISMGAGLVPIPILDIAAVTAVQMDMVKQLSWLYQIDHPGHFDKSLITSLTGSIFARIGASFIKAIPVVGSIIGGLSMAMMSGASTYAVGQVFSRHFAAGGDFDNFNPASARHIFEEELEKGKRQAEQWKKEKDATGATSSADTISKLKELNELRQAGAISEDEFARMKAKILEGF